MVNQKIVKPFQVFNLIASLVPKAGKAGIYRNLTDLEKAFTEFH